VHVEDLPGGLAVFEMVAVQGQADEERLSLARVVQRDGECLLRCFLGRG
jgi:hypothetical protein